MALEAIQAQAGHPSIESTRIYLHLANDWLAGEYRRAAEAIDAKAWRAGDAGRTRSRRRTCRRCCRVPGGDAHGRAKDRPLDRAGLPNLLRQATTGGAAGSS